MKCQGVIVAWLVMAGLFCRAGFALGEDTAAHLSPDARKAIAKLEDPDVYIRQKAFIQLEMLREPASARVIRSYLANKDASTRSFAVRAIAAVEGKKAVPVLIDKLLHDRKAQVRLEAALALEPLDAPEATQAFIWRLRDRSAQVRMAVADILSRIDEQQARDALHARWKRELNRDVRRVLRRAVRRIDSH